MSTMAPLNVTQITDRMRELDNDFRSIGHDYSRLADAKVRAERDREVAIAEAYKRAEGNSIDRRQAAIAEVGKGDIDTEAAYARVAADFAVAHDRAMIGASLLKAAKRFDEDPRYGSGP